MVKKVKSGRQLLSKKELKVQNSKENRTLLMKNLFNQLSDGVEIKKKQEFQNLVNFSDFEKHPIHRWFRYREGYSIELVKKLVDGNQTRILDPFCVSGTTLVASKELGVDSIGLDINPLATFISQTKIFDYKKSDIDSLKDEINYVLDVADNSPMSEKPGLRIIEKVFNKDILNILLQIKFRIDQIKTKEHNGFLKLGWLSILEAVSNTKKEGNGIKYKFTKRTKYGYIAIPQKQWEDKNFGFDKKQFVLVTIRKKYAEMITDLDISSFKNSTSKVYTGSSSDLSDYIKGENISTCIFSPPYANAFDYFEIFKVELWMGSFVKNYNELKRLRSKALRSNLNVSNINLKKSDFKQQELEELLDMLGKEVLWDKKLVGMLRGYFEDMYLTLNEVYSALQPNGKCVIVVGNSAYSNVIIPTDLLLARIGQNIGYKNAELYITRHLTTSSQQKEDLGSLKEFLRESVVILHKSSSNYTSVDELPNNKKIGYGEKFIITSNNISYLTHAFHKYPAKFIPQIPRWAISKYTEKGSGAIVLDPFCGSGTTLVEAIVHGNNAYGIDIDPLARLISRVKTTMIDKQRLDKVRAEIISKIENKDKGQFRPAMANLPHWFTYKAINDLSKIRDIIDEYKDETKIYDFLLVCFSSIIRRVSNADNESQKTYVSHTRIKTPESAIPLFKKNLQLYTQRIEELFTKVATGSKAFIFNDCTDSRNFANYWRDKVKTNADLVVTSPPYIKAIDYIYNQMVEYFWIGDLFNLQNQILQKAYDQQYMGTQAVPAKSYSNRVYTNYPDIDTIVGKLFDKDKKFAYILATFFIDMEKNIREIAKVLKKGGHYVIVIGNNTISGIPINSHELVSEIAGKSGFNVSNLFAYKIRNHYMRFPRKGRGGMIKEDWIVDLVKR